MKKKAKNIRILDGAAFSPWQLLSAANAYYALSCVLADQFPKDGNGATNGLPVGSAIAASATNRILAIELYLKAMLVGHNRPVPCDHDLVLLYDSLPEQTRDVIKLNFSENNNLDHAQGRLIELYYRFQLGSSLSKQQYNDSPEPLPKDTSLDGVLDRNRGGFVLSRYLFEKAQLDKPAEFLYEHWRLAILSGVLCQMLESALPAPPLHYHRPFQF